MTARSIFLSWEKWLRPAYNLILAGVACLVILSFTNMGYPVPRNGRTVFHFISRAIAANLLFTAGPLADYYISVLLGRRSVLVTGILFTLGTLFSMLVVPISVSWLWFYAVPRTQILRLTKPKVALSLASLELIAPPSRVYPF